ncbi:uncharacterized protein IL334_003378 [Kwoniella shivajii]|uniref:Peroxin domain-containing protein n=1 Tax=Kwoniella shivajii TaxID=564305 RepID=A0ABZ1CYK5_9TREE|nr:hypothetical protein IL334_003378 [Kwoniella shivajii]
MAAQLDSRLGPNSIPQSGSNSNTTKAVQSPKEETDAITSSLTARRRHSLGSIIRSYRHPSNSASASESKGKGKSKDRTEHVIEEEGVVGMGFGDGEGMEEGEETIARNQEDEEGQQESENAQRHYKLELEAYENSKGDPINIQKNINGKKLNINLENDCIVNYEKEYVWDVLFENQRGIFIFGKGNFSSRTLLPSDPSAFTRPSKIIPSASSLSAKKGSISAEEPAQPPSSSSSSNDKQSHRNQTQTRSNKTSYTLDTYQPPLPEWEYLTSWMINMRTGTDESGWRYNAWFKKKGWSSHAGPVGWGGWVRRREWIRLRAVGVDSVDGEGTAIIRDGREKVEQNGKHLKDVMRSEEIKPNVLEVLVVMGRLRLDRQRIELWSKWLENEKKDSNAWKRLEMTCSDEHAVSRHNFERRITDTFVQTDHVHI